MSALLAAVTAEPSAAAQLGRSLVGLTVCGLSARRGYTKAEAVERATGQLPRGWSPTTWSAVCFASLLIGHGLLGSSARGLASAPRPAAPAPDPSTPDPRFSWAPVPEPAPLVHEPPAAAVLAPPAPAAPPRLGAGAMDVLPAPTGRRRR